MSNKITGEDFLYNKNDISLTVVNNRGGFIGIGSGCEEYKNSDQYISENYPDAKELEAISNERYERYMNRGR